MERKWSLGVRGVSARHRCRCKGLAGGHKTDAGLAATRFQTKGLLGPIAWLCVPLLLFLSISFIRVHLFDLPPDPSSSPSGVPSPSFSRSLALFLSQARFFSLSLCFSLSFSRSLVLSLSCSLSLSVSPSISTLPFFPLEDKDNEYQGAHSTAFLLSV